MANPKEISELKIQGLTNEDFDYSFYLLETKKIALKINYLASDLELSKDLSFELNIINLPSNLENSPYYKLVDREFTYSSETNFVVCNPGYFKTDDDQCNKSEILYPRIELGDSSNKLRVIFDNDKDMKIFN